MQETEWLSSPETAGKCQSNPYLLHHQVFLQLSHSLGPGTRAASAAEIACPLEHVDERELSSKEARETIQLT